MYAWITARLIKPGMISDFIKAWQDPGMNVPVAPSSSGGPTLFSLHPTNNPNEMWGLGFFDSLETIESYKQSRDNEKRMEALAPYIAEVLWERHFEAHPWNESDRPLVYAVYLRTTPRRRYRLAVICPNARQAIEHADALVARAKASGYDSAEWTMRAYESSYDPPETLPAGEGHLHQAAS